MQRPATVALIGTAAVVVLAGCVRVSEGEPVARSPRESATQRSAPSTIPTPSAPDQDSPGIQPTQRTPVPAGSLTCPAPNRPPVSVAAAVADPAAPRLTVGVPDGWSFTRGAGDVAVTMRGSQGLSATVSITPTTLDPQQAFREYTDGVMATSAVSTVSILPAELCDYSGQQLTGTWSDGPDDAIEFVDRVAHLWTNAGDFLVAVHVEGPAGAEGLAAAATVLTDDVEVTIP